MNKRVLALLMAVVLLLAVCSACGSKPAEPVAEEPTTQTAPEVETGVVKGDVAEGEDVYARKTAEGTLTIGVVRDLLMLCPGNATSVAGFSLVYDKLWNYDQATQAFVPSLATAWEYEDECSLHIWLRDDVKWSDGTDFTAEDVLYTFYWEREFSRRAAEDFQCVDIDNCEIINDHELIVRTFEPNGPLMANLATQEGYIFSKSHVEAQTGDEFWWDNVVGTGPFVVVSNVQGDKAEFEANPNYWGENPGYDSVTLRYYSDAATMFMDYETGALDLCLEVTLEDYERVVNGDVEHSMGVLFPDKRCYCFCFNNNANALADIKVREALCHAIDIEAVTKVARGDLGFVATSSMPASAKYYTEMGGYEYDPELSKSLLAEAGYAAGDITITSVYASSEASNGTVLEVIQGMLAEVGITLTIEAYDNPTMLAMLWGSNNNGIPERDATIFSLSLLSYDPGKWYGLFTRDSSMTAFQLQDERANELIETGTNSVDDEVRAAAYAELQQYFYDNCFMLPLCEGYAAAVARDYVTADSVVALGDCAMPDVPMIRFVG